MEGTRWIWGKGIGYVSKVSILVLNSKKVPIRVNFFL